MGSPESVQQIVIVLKDSEQKGHGPSACQPLGRRKSWFNGDSSCPPAAGRGAAALQVVVSKAAASRGEGWGLLPKAQGLAQLVS